MKADLLRFDGAVEHDPAVDRWLNERAGALGLIARQWFQALRNCGDEVRELSCIFDGLSGCLSRRCALWLRQCLHCARQPGVLSTVPRCPIHSACCRAPCKFMLLRQKLKPGIAINDQALSSLCSVRVPPISRRASR